MTEQFDIEPPQTTGEHPGVYHTSISPWIDEQIWGHRLWDAQSPWLLFLEFLSIAEACSREDKLLDEEFARYPLVCYTNKRMYLRNILFNNIELARIADLQYAGENGMWQIWLDSMSKNADGVPKKDFSYLKGHFHSFDDFAKLVGMLRESAVESETNRRWTSRFVFPFGPNGLYVDLNLSASGKPTVEYINFGRTGELLYLMLCRSAHRSRLYEPLSELLSGNNPWNTLLGLLQPETDEKDPLERGKSYLPYGHHQTFDELGSDWLSIFNLQLPRFDAVPHLVTIGAFHIFLYQIIVATGLLRKERNPHMICEVVAPNKTLVRELSFINYQENVDLSAQAVEAYLDTIEHSAEWQNALKEPGAYPVCSAILKKHVRWPQKPGDYDEAEEPNLLIRRLRIEALRGHRQHVANVHRSYGRDIGLVSKRGTTKLRYAPNDALLKTLIAANIETRMELGEFLNKLFHRYGLVFGEKEAAQVLSNNEFDKKAFQANAIRLEQRLSSLGMLRRLSDSCAYVENPYSRRVL